MPEYSVCQYCGKEKTKNLSRHCNNDCRRKDMVKIKELAAKIRELIIQDGRALLETPTERIEMYGKVFGRLGIEDTRQHRMLAGAVLLQLARERFINIYPKVNSWFYVFYLSGSEEKAQARYAEEFRKLPVGVQTAAMKKKHEFQRESVKVNKLFQKGQSARNIALGLNMKEDRVKKLIGAANE